jgi:hypothetical protein
MLFQIAHILGFHELSMAQKRAIGDIRKRHADTRTVFAYRLLLIAYCLPQVSSCASPLRRRRSPARRGEMMNLQ